VAGKGGIVYIDPFFSNGGAIKSTLTDTRAPFTPPPPDPFLIMQYRLCDGFLKEMPWRSEWSGQADEAKVLQRLADHFPEAEVRKSLVLLASTKVHFSTDMQVYARELFISSRSVPVKPSGKRPTTADARILAAQKFAASGFLALDEAEQTFFSAKVRQHQLLDVIHFILGEPSESSLPEFRPPPYIETATAFEGAQKGFRVRFQCGALSFSFFLTRFPIRI
jgi:hypothetical protein